jgi:glycosyltransferase involved in cell wall biosynthesis
MRLLHVVPTYLPATRYGGPIYSVHGLCKALAARGHEVHVFTTSVDGPGDSAVPLGEPVELEGVRVWYFPSRRLRRLYWSPPLARALGRQVAGFDAVHLHSVFLWPTLAAARAAQRAGVPYLLAPRGMLVPELIARKSPWLKRGWLWLFERRTIEGAAAIHLTSAGEGSDLRRFGYRLPALLEVPNGVDWPEAPETACEREDDHLLFISRVHWKKGLDRLIPALAGLPGARLTIAGNDEEDYLPELRRLAEEHGVRARIDFRGPVAGGEKQRLLRQASALVLPSYSENFANIVLEAMAEGCPVVVTPEVGLAPVVAESGAGLVVSGEPAALAQGLAALLADPAGRRAMDEQGRARVRRDYCWDAVAGRMEAGYAWVIGPSPGR